MDALVTAANLLNVTAYFVKDRLWVRALAFAASCFLALYFTTRPSPLANALYWNFLFAALNAWLLGRIAMRRHRRRRRVGQVHLKQAEERVRVDRLGDDRA